MEQNHTYEYRYDESHVCPFDPEHYCRNFEVFKTHMKKCLVANGKTTYLCKYYFGHMFKTLAEALQHDEKCQYGELNYPVRYPNSKKTIQVGKAFANIIENEYYPILPEKAKQVIEEITSNQCLKKKEDSQITKEISIVNPIKQPAPEFGLFEPGKIFSSKQQIKDMDSESPTKYRRLDRREENNLIIKPKRNQILDEIVSDGVFDNFADFNDVNEPLKIIDMTSESYLEVKITPNALGRNKIKVFTFEIEKYEDIDKFTNFFSKDVFTQEIFDNYLLGEFSVVPDDTKNLNAYHKLVENIGDKIGINVNKGCNCNEALVVFTKNTKFLGKFLYSKIGLLVLPYGTMFNEIVSHILESYYFKEISTVINQNQNLESIDSNVKKLSSLKDDNLKILDIERIIEILEKTEYEKEKFMKFYEDSERLLKKIKSEQDEERVKIMQNLEDIKKSTNDKENQFRKLSKTTDDLKKEKDRELRTQEMWKFESVQEYDRKMNDFKSKAILAFKKKQHEIDESEMETRLKYQTLKKEKAEEDLKLNEKKKELERVKENASKAREAYLAAMQKKKDIEKKEKEKEKKGSDNILQSIRSLKHKICLKCNDNNKEVVYFPCFHMLYCKLCHYGTINGTLAIDDNSEKKRCKVCRLEIEEVKIVERISKEYYSFLYKDINNLNNE